MSTGKGDRTVWYEVHQIRNDEVVDEFSFDTLKEAEEQVEFLRSMNPGGYAYAIVACRGKVIHAGRQA